MAFVMLFYAEEQSFWVDELAWTIGIISKTNFAGLLRSLLADGYNLPLYYVLISGVYKISPYGELYLLIPSIACVIFGVIFIGMASKRLCNANLSAISLCVGAISTVLITYCGWEMRPYAMYFCFSSLTLLIFINRLKLENKRNIAIYSLSVGLLCFTHWFGILLVVFYGLADVCFWLKKKISFPVLFFSYAAPAALALIWLLLTLVNVHQSLSKYWAFTPDIWLVLEVLGTLLSNNIFFYFCFGVGILGVLLSAGRAIRRKSVTVDVLFKLQTIMCIPWLIGVTFIYSKYVNPHGSVFVFRYFIGVVPHVILLVALGVYDMHQLALRVIDKMSASAGWRKSITVCVSVLLSVAFGVSGYYSYAEAIAQQQMKGEPFRQVAEYLALDCNAHAPDALVLLPDSRLFLLDSWVEYYFEKRQFQIPSNMGTYVPRERWRTQEDASGQFLRIVNGKTIAPISMSEQDILKYRRLYLVEQHQRFEKEFFDFINEHYLLVKKEHFLDTYVYEKKS